MSPDLFQQVEIITCLLSGVSSLALKITRASLSALFSIRFAILLIGSKTIFLDEEKDFVCNSTRLLCMPSCFDEFSLISSFTLFALQMVVLFTHSVCVACFVYSTYQEKKSWLGAQLFKKTVQFKLHVIGLISRILIEVLFIPTYYKVKEGFVHRRTIHCRSTLCEKSVICTDVNSTVKNIFGLCLFALSVTCAMVILWELITSLRFFQHMNSSSTTQTSRKKQRF